MCECGKGHKRRLVLVNVPASMRKALQPATERKILAREDESQRFQVRHLRQEHGRLRRALNPLLKSYLAAVDEVLTRHGVYDALPR
jgi:hypothetical protein